MARINSSYASYSAQTKKSTTTKKATSVTSSVVKKVATSVANTAYRYTASKTTKASSTKKSGNSYSSNTSSAKKTASSAKKSTTSTQNKTTTTTVKTSDKVKNLVKNMAVTVIKAQQPVYSAGKKVVSTINNINSNIREKAKNSKALDVVQSGLDVAGLIPGVGEIADGTNALIYAGRGDYVNAGFSAAACVPFIGSFSTGAKTVGKGVKVVKATKTVANGADTAKKISTAAKTVDKAKDVTKQVSNAVDAGKALKSGGKTIDIELKYKDGWTETQKAEADAKLKALSEAKTVKTPVTRSGTSASSRYKSVHGNESIPDTHDVDHTIDLQLGGDDTVTNMNPLDKSVNRSLGTQIQNAIKNYPYGTEYGKFTIH